MPIDWNTDKQNEIYSWIFNQTMNNGFQPSIREIQGAFSIPNPTTVARVLAKLESRGWVVVSTKARGIRFLCRPDGTPFNGFSLK